MVIVLLLHPYWKSYANITILMQIGQINHYFLWLKQVRFPSDTYKREGCVIFRKKTSLRH